MSESTELVDPRTGELRLSAAELAVAELLEIPSGVFGPTLAAQDIDHMITEIADLIEHAAKVIVRLYEDVHRAEETYQARFSDFMTMHEKSGAQLARQYAHAKTLTELHELNLAKEKLRYAEEMQKSLQNRSFGLMNIGKRYTAAMGFGPR